MHNAMRNNAHQTQGWANEPREDTIIIIIKPKVSFNLYYQIVTYLFRVNFKMPKET